MFAEHFEWGGGGDLSLFQLQQKGLAKVKHSVLMIFI
jgi:hypothetical protein